MGNKGKDVSRRNFLGFSLKGMIVTLATAFGF